MLVQIADVVLENFNLPERVMQGIILCTALGFPIAVLLAWIFDITPAGIRRTAALKASAEGAAPVLDDDRRGLVVLPFDAYSDEPTDEILSSGFTEDLTTLLSRIPGFFVISRSTAYAYKGQQEGVREIGRELGVRYLLRGSLRRQGEKLRVTAQLIEAETGSHLWADNYDTPVEDLAQVQDELLNSIAVQLGAELARAEFRLTRRWNSILTPRKCWVLPVVHFLTWATSSVVYPCWKEPWSWTLPMLKRGRHTARR